MRLSRRSRYLASGGTALGVAVASFVGLPGLAIFAPIIGLGAGALAFSVLTAWVRHARRERHNQKFE